MTSSTQKPRSPCPIANALELLGDRWSMLIIRDLLFTDRREFGQFLAAGEGISTNILSDRLERLLCAGIISKAAHPSHGKKFLYDLTERGLSLAPTIIEFGLWADDNIDGARLPTLIKNMMIHEREQLLDKIARREPLLNVG